MKYLDLSKNIRKNIRKICNLTSNFVENREINTVEMMKKKIIKIVWYSSFMIIIVDCDGYRWKN